MISKRQTVEVISLEPTNFISPQAWKGKTSDDRMIYIRFRSGTLTISLSKAYGVDDRVGCDLIYEAEIGDEWLEPEELINLVPNIKWTFQAEISGV